MKKNNFIEGTLIATFAIILVKILGMLYVIPFYKIVGENGGALYSYAYNIYLIFLSISSAGLPSAVSKVISEYNTLGYDEAKNRAYNIAKKIISIVAVIAFVILFVFAEEIGKFIIGDLNGVNTYQDVAFVIRCIAPAVLIIPFLSITKGFLQGHKYIKPTSIAELIEQLIRIFIILCGSYLCFKVFNGSLSTTIGIAVSGAFFGGVVSYIYLKRIINKNKIELGFSSALEKDNVESKEIAKKIITYAIPFIIISLVTHLYNLTDQILILRALNHLGYNPSDVEFIASGISTWAPKICTIITALASGMAIALIPTIVQSHTKGDKDEVSNNINKAISLVTCVSLPLVLGIFMLNKSVWCIFYTNNTFGFNILALAVFSSLLANVYTVLSSILQSLNKFKFVYIVSITGFVTNALLDIPMMLLFDRIGIPAYLGSIISSIIGFSLSIAIGIIFLKHKEGINFKDTIKNILKNMVPSLAIVLVLVILNILLPFNNFTKLGGLFDVLIKVIIAGSIYLVITYRMGILDELLGRAMVSKIIKKITLGKVVRKEN